MNGVIRAYLISSGYGIKELDENSFLVSKDGREIAARFELEKEDTPQLYRERFVVIFSKDNVETRQVVGSSTLYKRVDGK